LIGHFAPASAEPLVVPAEISKIVSELIVFLEYLSIPGRSCRRRGSGIGKSLSG